MSKVPSTNHRQRRIDELSNLNLAKKLILRRMKTKLVHLATNISEARIREMYHDFHDERPTRGPILGEASILATHRRRREGSIFYALYVSWAGGLEHCERGIINWNALLYAFDAYVAILREEGITTTPLLGINEVYQLAKSLGSQVFLAKCRCQAVYPILSTAALSRADRPVCQVCPACMSPAEIGKDGDASKSTNDNLPHQPKHSKH